MEIYVNAYIMYDADMLLWSWIMYYACIIIIIIIGTSRSSQLRTDVILMNINDMQIMHEYANYVLNMHKLWINYHMNGVILITIVQWVVEWDYASVFQWSDHRSDHRIIHSVYKMEIYVHAYIMHNYDADV